MADAGTPKEPDAVMISLVRAGEDGEADLIVSFRTRIFFMKTLRIVPSQDDGGFLIADFPTHTRPVIINVDTLFNLMQTAAQRSPAFGVRFLRTGYGFENKDVEVAKYPVVLMFPAALVGAMFHAQADLLPSSRHTIYQSFYGNVMHGDHGQQSNSTAGRDGANSINVGNFLVFTFAAALGEGVIFSYSQSLG
jgi:hypothetical protein